MHRSIYNKTVKVTNSNRIVISYFLTYAWFWYHTQWYINPPELRRPYTFLFRDWLMVHKIAFTVIMIMWYIGVLALTYWRPYLSVILTFLSSMLLAHLIWGNKWVPNEQEEPPYLDSDFRS
jgi:hypothetical protein